MNLTSANAATAYANALLRGKEAPSSGPDVAAKAVPGPGFADLVQDIVQGTAKGVGGGEQATIQSITGDSELIDLVTAVTNAEVTLQTVVAVRDRVIQAYQDIIQMPI